MPRAERWPCGEAEDAAALLRRAASEVPGVACRGQPHAMQVQTDIDARAWPGKQLGEQIRVVHLAVERGLRVAANGRQHLEERPMPVVGWIAVAGGVQISAAQPRLPP